MKRKCRSNIPVENKMNQEQLVQNAQGRISELARERESLESRIAEIVRLERALQVVLSLEGGGEAGGAKNNGTVEFTVEDDRTGQKVSRKVQKPVEKNTGVKPAGAEEDLDALQAEVLAIYQKNGEAVYNTANLKTLLAEKGYEDNSRLGYKVRKVCTRLRKAGKIKQSGDEGYTLAA